MTLILFGTGDGVVAYDFDGKHWQRQWHSLKGQYVSVVKHHPHNPDILFAGTYGAGLYRSLDCGQSWAQVAADMPVDYIRGLTFTPDSVLVGAEPAAIVRSDDNGETWHNSPLDHLPGASEWFLPYSPRDGCVRSFATHAHSPGLIYAAIEVGGVLKSTDDGMTWESLTGGFTGGFADGEKGTSLDVHSIAVRPDDAQTLFAATHNGVYRTQDGGETWTHLSHGYTRGVVMPFDSPDTVIATPGNGPDSPSRVIISHDAGDNWEDVNVPKTETTIDFLILHPNLPDVLFGITPGVPSRRGDDGLVLYSPIDNIQWQMFSDDFKAVQWVDVLP